MTKYAPALIAWVLFGAATTFAAPEKATPAKKPAADQAAAAAQPVSIDVMPKSIKFTTPKQYFHLVITGKFADGRVQDLTRTAAYKSTDAKVARVETGVVNPTGNGKASIEITVGNLKAAVPVEAVEQQTPERVSFD